MKHENYWKIKIIMNSGVTISGVYVCNYLNSYEVAKEILRMNENTRGDGNAFSAILSEDRSSQIVFRLRDMSVIEIGL